MTPCIGVCTLEDDICKGCGRTIEASGSKPSNPKLYASVKAEAKRKFKVYPSAYANAWLVRTYKKRGGGYA